MQDTSAQSDEHIRPQDDLYRHVNGAWLDDTQIPEDEAMWGNSHEMQKTLEKRLRSIIEELLEREDIAPGSVEQKVRDFYLSGRDDTQAYRSGKAWLRSIADKLEEVRSSSDIMRITGELHRCGFHPFFDMVVEPDEKQSDRYRLYVHQGGLSLPDKGYYDESRDDMRELQAAFTGHIPTMLDAVSEKPDDTIGEDIYRLERRLAQASRSRAELRDVETNYNRYDDQQLRKDFEQLDWEAYFAGLGVDTPAYTVIGQPEFFDELAVVFDQQSIDDLRQYIYWHILKGSAAFLGKDVAALNFDFFGRRLQGVQRMKPQWKRIIRVLDASMGEAIGALYVRRYFPENSKQQIETMVDYLKRAFSQRIDQLEWMETPAKNHAKRKLDNTIVKIGYPDEMDTYEALEITPDSYLDNYTASQAYEADFWLARLDSEVDRSLWLMSPATINAYFMPTTNEIAFPAGILQPPFFDSQADISENYGGIGAVIGHELTHGFDDQGSQYDAEGNINRWRSEREQETFNTRAQVMVKQASQYEVLDGEHLQGELTLGENIADVGGLKMALKALELAYQDEGHKLPKEDAEKLFYNFMRIWRQKIRPEFARQLLLIDPHAPGEFRANNSARNIPAFYDVFDITPGDLMYLEPDKRLDIW